MSVRRDVDTRVCETDVEEWTLVSVVIFPVIYELVCPFAAESGILSHFIHPLVHACV